MMSISRINFVPVSSLVAPSGTSAATHLPAIAPAPSATKQRWRGGCVRLEIGDASVVCFWTRVEGTVSLYLADVRTPGVWDLLTACEQTGMAEVLVGGGVDGSQQSLGAIQFDFPEFTADGEAYPFATCGDVLGEVLATQRMGQFDRVGRLVEGGGRFAGKTVAYFAQ